MRRESPPPLAAAALAAALLAAALPLRARAQCTFVPHQDYDEGNNGPHVPASSPEDCCAKCLAAGPAKCWAAVYGPFWSPARCYLKTQDQTTRPYQPDPASVVSRTIQGCWPAGRTPPTSPPPGCKVDVSTPFAFVCVGQSLALRPCNCSAAAQSFFADVSGGSIRHLDFSTAPGYGDVVQASFGNNEGFAARLSLQGKPELTGALHHPDQSWWERDRTAGVTIVTNINTTGVNVSDVNVSAAEGCRQWALENEAMVDGAYLVPAPCVAGAQNRSWGFNRTGTEGCIAALYDEKNASSLSGLCVSVESFRAADGPYIVDDAAGFTISNDGVGVSAGEGSARLLFDYASPGPRDEILDYLFKPGYALRADILKLEIGGDGDVMQGSSPSHQHFAGEAPNMGRGVVAWLAREARARNPAIKLYAVPYSFPGWLRQGQPTSSPFATPAAAVAAAGYVVAWLQGMRDLGTTVDVIGIYSDNWDPVLSPLYAAQLRTSLSAAGLSTLILCDDSSGGWPCATQATDSTSPFFAPGLLDTVDIFAGHGNPSAALIAALAATGRGKPLWNGYLDNEGRSDLLGATMLAWAVSEAAVSGGCAAAVVWAATCSSYDGMPRYNQGLIRADQPWSGHYYVSPSVWALAHTSAFNLPGYMRLMDGSGVGVLAGSGSFVTRMDPTDGSFSIVISKGANHDYARTLGLKAEVVSFALRSRALAAAQSAGVAVGLPQGALHVFSSNFGGSPSGNASFARYLGTTALYRNGGAGDWLVSAFSGLDTIVTLTTSLSLFPEARPVTTPAPAAAFPRQFSADWTTGARAAGAPAPFLVDISGSFEFVEAPTPGLQQLAADVPLTRFQTDVAPHAILGDEQWTDVSLTARVWLPAQSDSAMIAVRASGFGAATDAGEHVLGMDQLPALWLCVNGSGDWALTSRLDASAVTLGKGRLPVPPALQQWHTLQLVARGPRAVARLDGALLASVSVALSGAPLAGFVAIGARAFGHKPIFGGVSIDAMNSTCSAWPQEGHALVEEACSPGSAGQAWSFVPLGRSGVGQFVSAVNASLCLAANRSADAGFMGDSSARGTFVARCDAEEPRQQFLVETSIADGPLLMGPIQGPDRLTLNVKNDDATANSFICAYPWQGNSNAIWTLNSSGTIWNALYGTCITSCDAQT